MKDKEIDSLKEKYLPGMRIKLIYMEGEERMSSGLKGTVVCVDDIGQIHMRWDNGSTLAINVEHDSFEIIRENEKISVILVEPNKLARRIEIEDKLVTLQKLVGGYIEEYMPFEDDIALIINEEGKLEGLPLNRAVRNEDGEIIDIVAGPFLIAYAPIESENFLSLPADLERKYFNTFRMPEKFFRTENGFESIPFEPMMEDMQK